MSKQNDLISVIIPVYNIEPYIEKCIQSVLNQTYSRLEIIVIDDGSTDNSYEVCEKFSHTDERIKVYHQENMGLSTARNSGIERAFGSLIMFIDGDDVIHPQMIELLYSALQQTSASVSVCRYEKTYDYNEISIKHEEIKFIKEFTPVEAIKALFNHDLYIPFTVAWNKLYRKEIFDNIKYPAGKIHEDEYTAYKIFFDSTKIAYIENILYYYMQRSGSIMSSSFSKKRFDKVDAYIERMIFFIDNNILVEKGVKSCLHYYVNFLATYKKYCKKDRFYRKKKSELIKLWSKYSSYMSMGNRVETIFKILIPLRDYKFLKRVIFNRGYKEWTSFQNLKKISKSLATNYQTNLD